MTTHRYITTTLPYVNSDPHIGFAAEIVHADILARYYRDVLRQEVFFNTGTDEHGIKVYTKAQESAKDPQAYVDEYAEKFRNLKGTLGLSEELHFIRTTDDHHKKAAQEFWRRVRDNGFIYKKNYKVKYCVGCELEKTDSELVNGRCPIHPNREIELIEEENYFFKFSAFKEKLEKLYADQPDFVVPDFRFNEIKAFVSRGLEDFSISRLKTKMPWGVDVPEDSEHVMYVWFDALVNYISTLGWPENEKDSDGDFAKFWGTLAKPNALQIAGKDNLRQQSAMWQSMLMAAGLPNTRQVIIRGFITSGGQKMSKSLGNVINPNDIVAEYGTEALRYFLAREVSPFEDSDVTMEKFKTAYNAGLANALGNTVSRVMKMATAYLQGPVAVQKAELPHTYKDFLAHYEIKLAADFVWSEIAALERNIQEKAPFKLVKTEPEAAHAIIRELVVGLATIADMLVPFLPQTSAAIHSLIKEHRMPENPLFMRRA